jgi:hypothetical protein
MAVPRTYDLLINGMPYVLDHLWARAQGIAPMRSLEEEASIPIQRPDHEVGAYLAREKSDWYVEAYRNWQDGSGQRSLDHADADRSRFYSSYATDGSRQGELRLAPATVGLTAVAGAVPTAVACEGMGRLWCVWHGAHDNLYFYNQASDTWSVAPGTHPTDGSITACCSDGDYVYFAVTGSTAEGGAGNGVWKVRASTSSSKISALQKITGMCVVTGHLCVARDQVSSEEGVPNGSSAGFLDFTAEPNRAYVPCTPTGSSFWGPNLVSEELCALNSYAYWLVRSGEGAVIGEEAKVMRFSPIAEAYDFGEVQAFPVGFTGECMCSYLDVLYVGGYEKVPTYDDAGVSDSGMGEIYRLEPGGTWERVVHIGEEELADSRIFALTPYERFIYFIAGSQLYRYSIVHGGYEHAGQLASGVETLYWTDIGPSEWTETWDGSTAPPIDFVLTKSPTPNNPDLLVESSDGVTYLRANNRSWAVWRHADAALTGNAMMEFKVQGIVSNGGMHGIGNSDAALIVRTVAGVVFDGGTYCYVYLRRRSVGNYIWDLVGVYPDWRAAGNDPGHWVTIRLQLDHTNRKGLVFVNGVLRRSVDYVAISTAEPVWGTTSLKNAVFFSVGSPDEERKHEPVPQTRERERIYFDYLRYVRGVIVDPPPVTYRGDVARLVARYGSVFAVISSRNVYRTRRSSESAYATYGWMRVSDSSMGIDGVKKYLRYIDVLHESLKVGEEIRLTTYVDGEPYEVFVLNQAACAGERLSSISLPTGVGTRLAIDCYTAGFKIEFFGPGTSTPLVSTIVLRCTLETVNRYIYVLDCQDQSFDASDSGVYQEYSGETLIDNLRQIKGRAVEFWSPISGTFIGKFEDLELHHWRASDESESEYHGTVVLKVREL